MNAVVYLAGTGCRWRMLLDEAIIALLLNTSLRVQELCSLDIGDVVINPRGGTVIVRSSKRRKQREVPLNANVRSPLSLWLAEREQIAGDGDALFVTKYHKHIGTESTRISKPNGHLSITSSISGASSA